MFWLIGTAFMLRNFLTLTTLGDFYPSVSRKSRFTGFTEISRPRLGPETGQKRQKVDFPSLGGRSGLDAPRPKLFAC